MPIQIMQHPENPYTKKLLASPAPCPTRANSRQHRAHLHELPSPRGAIAHSIEAPRQRELTFISASTAAYRTGTGRGRRRAFVLDVSNLEQLQPLARAGPGSGQVIQIEPADAQVLPRRLRTARHCRRASGRTGTNDPCTWCCRHWRRSSTLSDEGDATKSVTRASMPVSSPLISRTTVSAGCSPGSLMP